MQTELRCDLRKSQEGRLKMFEKYISLSCKILQNDAYCFKNRNKMDKEKERRLLSPEREQAILDELEQGPHPIGDLSVLLRVSEATVRRDLLSLEKKGRIRRVHGGAVRVAPPPDEPVFEEKESIRSSEKEKIARRALSEIEDGDTVFLDGGSTALSLARLLPARKNLTVVTNSLMAASELSSGHNSLIVVGGRFRPLSRTLVGALTAKTLECLHFDKAFVGTMGFTADAGISTTDPDEAFTKELVIRRSEKVFLIADSSKLGVASFSASGNISDIDFIITDPAVSGNFVKQLRKKGVKVIKA